MRRPGTTCALMIVATCSIVPFRARATDELQQARIEMGRIWYQKYCTPCHGPGGIPGAAVSSATKQPVDLRTYVQRNGGKFPSGKWLSVVFAPQPGNVHTAVWEKIRSVNTESMQSDAVARGVVANIAEYVISIQKE